MSDASGPSARAVNDRWWRGLAARSTIAIGVLLAGMALVITLTAALYVRAEGVAAIERRLARDADRIALALDGRTLAQASFAELTAGSVDYAYVALPDGRLVAGVAPATSMTTFSQDALARSRTLGLAALVEANGVSHAAKVVTLPDGATAVLHVGRSLSSATAAMRDIIIYGLLATLAFLILALPLAALLIDRAASPLRTLTRAVTRPGSAKDEMSRVSDRHDEIGALARAHLSISRNLAESAEALHRLTFDDPLTLLPNRSSLISRLSAALQVGQGVALIKLEVDGLARVAAGLGQQHGDDAIRRAAEWLRKASGEWALQAALPPPRGGDPAVFLARISDCGFAMLAPGADADAAEALARRALAAFETPMPLGEHHVTLTIAVGVAIGPADGDEAGALLRSAAAALEAARAAGPQSVRAAAADLNRLAYGRLRAEQDLRRALENHQLEVHFQPQIALKTNAVSGAEALVRWRHPTRGLVPPIEFVAVAEECGLVEPLGRFVLAEACRMSAAWAAIGIELRIAVNVSTIQFRHPRFAETTLQIIRASGAAPSSIELEITESAAMGDPTHAARELAPLKAAGVSIAIDDFGTGYSNLATLTQLPFNVLKIDRAFVRDALVVPAARVVVGTIIAMAEKLGFETVAEGVETVEQLELVRGYGCTHAQGYLFGRPMAAAALEAWYANRMVDELKAIGGRAAATGPLAARDQLQSR
ncbi:MAG TPA: bifunctional diguanylate cyclase/phosphodiesterase [Hansschlegelia sp.]